jgi:hypothetical protein
MKINQMQMAVLALIVIGLLYLYNNPMLVYKNKPVYYPVYEKEYVPFNRHINRGFRPDPRGRVPRPGRIPHPGHIPGYHKWISRGGKIGHNGRPLPGSGGGGI